MCAALFTSHVKFRESVYRITTCEKNAQKNPSPQQYKGITTGRMKQSNIFIGINHLVKSNENHNSKIMNKLK